MGQTQFRSDDTVKWWLGFGDGSDGDYSSAGNATDAPVDSSCSGTAGSTSLSATNASFAAGKPVLIHQTRGTGAGNWELNQIDSYTAGTITLKKVLQNTYTDSGASQAQVIQLKQYNNFTQNSGHTLTAKAWDGNVGGIVAFLAKGTVTITGTITSSGKGFTGGSLGANSQVAGDRGNGYPGDGTNGNSANGNGGGGGNPGTYGQSSSGGGGGGGNGANGTAGSNTTSSPSVAGGAAGLAYGTSGLTVMSFGGGGASGGGINYGSGNPGDGGTGGGIILIISKEISVSGTIVTNGTGGTNGVDYTGGGGGGAAGSILLKAKIATLGTTKITATGGSGGAKAHDAGNGGAGAVGRIHLDYSGSYTGTTTPTLDYTLDTTIVDVGGSSSWFMFM